MVSFQPVPAGLGLETGYHEGSDALDSRAHPNGLRICSGKLKSDGGLAAGCERYEQDVFTLLEREQRKELCGYLSLYTLSRCFLSSGHELVNDFLE